VRINNIMSAKDQKSTGLWLVLANRQRALAGLPCRLGALADLDGNSKLDGKKVVNSDLFSSVERGYSVKTEIAAVRENLRDLWCPVTGGGRGDGRLLVRQARWLAG
jgi:hypothetical protein